MTKSKTQETQEELFEEFKTNLKLFKDFFDKKTAEISKLNQEIHDLISDRGEIANEINAEAEKYGIPYTLRGYNETCEIIPRSFERMWRVEDDKQADDNLEEISTLIMEAGVFEGYWGMEDYDQSWNISSC